MPLDTPQCHFPVLLSIHRPTSHFVQIYRMFSACFFSEHTRHSLWFALVGQCTEYEACPESIQPFWISREPFVWPWCNLAASDWTPYCAPLNSHSSVGLVSRQWDAVDLACVVCDHRIHNDRAIRSVSSRQCAYQFYGSHVGFFFCQSIASPSSVSPPTAQIWPPVTSGCSQS